jgi:hypothetical protein
MQIVYYCYYYFNSWPTDILYISILLSLCISPNLQLNLPWSTPLLPKRIPLRRAPG